MFGKFEYLLYLCNMRILNTPTRLQSSTFRSNIFLVLIDYGYRDSGYGKSVKDTIYSFTDLTEAQNFKDYKKKIIDQIPFYSLDLITYRFKTFYRWIRKRF